ncbi:hypothetical protein ACTPD5_20590, partial [Clostridioides difficile]
KQDEKDQRVSRIFLTDKGLEICNKVEEFNKELEREFFLGFSDPIMVPSLGGILAGYSLALPFFTGAGISFIAFLLILTLLPESIERSGQT